MDLHRLSAQRLAPVSCPIVEMQVVEPPSILFVVNAMWFFLSHRLPVALAALQRGYRVHVAGDIESDDEIASLQRHGFLFHRVKIVRGFSAPWHDVSTLLRLCSLYRQLDPSIIHHVTIKPIILGSIAARLASNAVVVNAVSGLGHVFGSRGLRAMAVRWPVKLVYRWALSGTRSISIFQNAADRAALFGRETPENSCLIAGSGVDLQRFSPHWEPDPTLVVLMPARALKDKGVREFCHASRILREEGQVARFVLAGRLDLSNPSHIEPGELESLCASCGVEWVGEQDDMVSWFRRASIVCLPSYREGFPKALMEACAAGRAIVTTSVPGCSDVVTDEVNGLLVPARDPRALANAIRRLLADPALRLSMGRRGRLRAEQDFNVDNLVAQTMEIYERARTLRSASC